MPGAVALVSVTLAATLCPLLPLASASQDSLRLEREAAASRWAPQVWLHPAENYFPSSVPHFLQHIVVGTVSQGQAAAQQGSAAPEPTLPSGMPSRDFFLMTQHNFGCPRCALPGFLQGEKPNKKYSPPVYVTVHSCYPVSTALRIRSTQGPLLGDDELIDAEMSTEEADEESNTTTAFPHTEYTSASSGVSPSLPSTTPSLPSNQTYPQPSISFQSNQMQIGRTHSPASYLGAANPHILLNEGNLTSTSPSICIHNSSLCARNNGENNTRNSNEDILRAEHIRSLHTENIRMRDDIVLKTTETPTTDEVIRKSFTEFSSSSRITTQRSPTQVNDTDDLANSSTRKRHHRTERRHARLRDQPFPSQQLYTVTYWMFYPYNRGKKVCTVNLGSFLGHMFKPRVNGVCHGEEITMGNHVGDWEHVSIQFRGSRPSRMYVSTHTFGAYYAYDPPNHRFVYEGEDTREGIPMSPVYPQTIQLTGSHPILYSARGSHGLWGAEGINRYNSLPILQDETGQGTPWKTWKNLKLVDAQDLPSQEPHRNWWRYEGRWGDPSSKCHLLLAGLCEHVSGPTGIPRKRINFPCQRI